MPIVHRGMLHTPIRVTPLHARTCLITWTLEGAALHVLYGDVHTDSSVLRMTGLHMPSQRNCTDTRYQGMQHMHQGL